MNEMKLQLWMNEMKLPNELKKILKKNIVMINKLTLDKCKKK